MASATTARSRAVPSVEPVLGWTYLSRDALARAKAQMDEESMGVRDEIGFLTIHQGYADRFFPGTSVLHTRARYLLFVPWLFEDLAPAAGPAAQRALRERERVLEAQERLFAEADAWLSGPSEDDEELTRIDLAGLDETSLRCMREALDVAVTQRNSLLREQANRRACQDELRAAAGRVYAPSHRDVFLNAVHPRLGKSPLSHCSDRRTLSECIALLPRKRIK